MSDNIILVNKDKNISLLEGELVTASFDAEALIGEPCTSITNEKVGKDIDICIKKGFSGEISVIEIENDKLPMILSLEFNPFKNKLGETVAVMIRVSDITKDRLVSIVRQYADERFKALFEKGPIGMAVISLKGRFIQVNESLCNLTKYSKEELEDKLMTKIVAPDYAEEAKQLFKDILAHSENNYPKVEHKYITKDNEDIWVSISSSLVKNEEGDPVYLVCQIEDITASREFENKLKELAEHDALTGLLNRRAFNLELEKHIDNNKRYGANGALLMIDLDGFKFVNDTLGHNAGDQLLVAVANDLKNRLRSTDILARLGGDEFVVILPEVNRDQAWNVAQSLVETIRNCSLELQGELSNKVTASIGVSLFKNNNLTFEEMLISSDLAMYEAKESGRNRVSIYDEVNIKTPKMKIRMETIEKISSALEEDRFVLYAQPIVDIKTNETKLHELLIRMKDTENNIIYPNDFLPLAERFDLIYQIDRFVIRSVIERIEELASQNIDFPVSINISANSLLDDALLEIIEEDLNRCKYLNRKNIIFEITETTAVAEMEVAKKFNQKIMELGCQIALDDFGSGYGSFYYIKHLPFDILKIDGEFVKDALNNAIDKSILKSISAMAKDLNKITVAEFVENQETIELLKEYDIDLVQGYHLGKPRDLEEVISSLTINAF